jgi:SAM-dependent methyltransferase
MSEDEIKRQVRQFYDRVGWKMVGEGLYQNARYEDLRPVASQYIHRCHLRINRYLKPQGRYLLDAGSGPIQYPEYLTYSEGYQRRVCVDISITALQEARKRIGAHGLFVVADVARLPFKAETFEGLVSLHTLHHLPLTDQKAAYIELQRVLAGGCAGVVVNGWTDSALMRWLRPLVILAERLAARLARRGPQQPAPAETASPPPVEKTPPQPTGTFVQKLDADWLRRELGGRMEYEIYVWRSVSVRFLRALIHPGLGGRFWLHLLFWLEDRFPHFFGEKGQYPLIVICKRLSD